MFAPLLWILRVLTMSLSFIYVVIVLNPIQILSALVYPFSKSLCRKINCWCARQIWGLWVIMAEKQNGIEFRFTGDELPLRENAFVTANHQSIADIMVLLTLSWRCKRVGATKWFVKDILKYLPGVGWGMLFIDCVFLKRDWTRDRGFVMDLFAKFEKENIPLFLVSFLEGTRLTQSKQKRARVFAEERGLHIPEHTLVPRTKGFVATMHGLRNHLDAVYDVTLGYPDGVPSLFDCFVAQPKRIEVHVTRYPIDLISTDEDAMEEWVFERYVEKDALMAELAETSYFPGEERFGPINALDHFRSERA